MNTMYTHYILCEYYTDMYKQGGSQTKQVKIQLIREWNIPVCVFISRGHVP